MTARLRQGDDAGSVLVLSLGFAILAIVLVLVGASATQVQLERTRLAQLADELALEAADAMDVSAYYAGDAREPDEVAALDLSLARMRTAAERRLPAAASRLGLDGARVVSVSTPDGHTAVVTVEVVVRPLFPVEVLAPWSHGITLRATGSARVY